MIAAILRAGAPRAPRYYRGREKPRRFDMFRLIKLAFYAVLGYALYELYQGMTAETGGGGGSSRGRGSLSRAGESLGRALNEAGGRMQTLTGEGTGMRESTLDPDGGSVPHQVGRGVVSR